MNQNNPLIVKLQYKSKYNWNLSMIFIDHRDWTNWHKKQVNNLNNNQFVTCFFYLTKLRSINKFYQILLLGVKEYSHTTSTRQLATKKKKTDSSVHRTSRFTENSEKGSYQLARLEPLTYKSHGNKFIVVSKLPFKTLATMYINCLILDTWYIVQQQQKKSSSSCVWLV